MTYIVCTLDISQKYHRIPRMQSAELKKFNKLKGTSEEDSIPFWRKKKAITGWGREEGRLLNGRGDIERKGRI